MYGRTDRRDFCTYILRIVNFSILVIIKKCYHIAKKVMVNVDKVCVTIYLTSFTKLSVRGTDIYSIVFIRRKYLTPCSFSDYISIIILFYYIITRRLQRRSLRLPTRSKSAQTGHLCTTAQAGADPGIFVCRSKFPGLKVGRRS